MFHDNDQYTLRREIDGGGFTHYYISFTDEQGENHDTKVLRTVFAAYLRFGKDERNLRRWDERHKERLDLSEQELHARALRQPHSMEKLLIDAEEKEMLRQAITKLPEIQRRRLLMHYEDGMTFEEIAIVEKCRKQSVHESVRLAEKQIREKLQKP